MKFRACIYDGHRMLVTKFKSLTLSYFKMADYSIVMTKISRKISLAAK